MVIFGLTAAVCFGHKYGKNQTKPNAERHEHVVIDSRSGKLQSVKKHHILHKFHASPLLKYPCL